MALLHGRRAGLCDVCGGRCQGFPDVDHPDTYPFLPGGRDPLAGKRWIEAPHRVVDHELGRVVYGTGDRVPLDDAVKYGLIEAPSEVPAEPKARPKGKRRPAEDRARKLDEDR